MKRIFAAVLALLLLCGVAAAETVTVPVWQEEDFTTVDVEMERYESALGLTMAYDPAHFAPDGTDPNTLRFTEYEFAFLTFQSSDELLPSKLAEGLALQSGTDDCVVNQSVLGGLFSDSISATGVFYQETVENVSYQRAFFLIPRAQDTLIVEYAYPFDIEMDVSSVFSAMLQTIEVTGISDLAAAPAATAKPAAQSGDDKVQCEICGGWFKAGNEFRNHICVEYPAADDNMTETYPSEDNMTETYPSEDNATYPAE